MKTQKILQNLTLVIISVFVLNSYSQETGKFTDSRDGKSYGVVKIGNQIWMSENLNYDTPNSFSYENIPGNGELYGKLYQWSEALHVCPEGWYLPSDMDWKILEGFLGESDEKVNKQGSRNNPSVRNSLIAGGSSGLNLEMNGWKNNDRKKFYHMGIRGSFWSSTEAGKKSAWIRFIDKNNLVRHDNQKTDYFSVRCISNSNDIALYKNNNGNENTIVNDTPGEAIPATIAITAVSSENDNVVSIQNNNANVDLDYSFINTDLEEDDFNAVKLFFRYGNSLPVTSVKISPDSKVLATLDQGGNIVIWDINSRRQIMTINGAKDQISTILFTPDGKYLMGSGQPRWFKKEKKCYLYYWDYKTGKVAFKNDLEFPIINMHISPDNTKLYTIGTKSGIQVRDLKNGDLIKKIKLGLTVGLTFAISPDGNYFVFGNSSEAAKASKIATGMILGNEDREGFIQVRDFNTGKNIKEFHAGKSGSYNFLQDAIFTKNGEIILIGNFEKGNFIIYNISTKKNRVIKSKKKLNIRMVEKSNDGKYFYVSTPDKLVKIDSRNYEIIESYPTNDIISDIDFSKNGKFFVTGGGDVQMGTNMIRVWDYKTDKQLDRFESKVASIVSAVVVPNNNNLVIGTNDGQVQIMDLTSGSIIKTLDVGTGSVMVKVTKSGSYIVTSATDYTTMKEWRYPSITKIWNSQTYELIQSIPDFNNAIISPDDKSLLVSNTSLTTKLKLIDFKTGNIIREKKILGMFIPKAFSKNGDKILTAAAGTFKIRDAITFKKVAVGDKYKGFKGTLLDVKYNDDETKILGAVSRILKNKGALIEWNVNGEIDRVLYQNDSAEVWTAAYHPHKDLILCSQRNKDETNELVVFDSKTGSKIISKKNVGLPMEYTPDGEFILAFANSGKMGISIIDANNYELQISYLKANGVDGYALYTSDFYYTITKNARDAVSFIKAGKVYPFEQFDLKFNRPDIIADKMPYSDNNLVDMYERVYQKRLQKMGITENMLLADFNTPDIIITNADKLPISSIEKKVNINIEAHSPNSDLIKLLVWVNDVPVYGSNGLDVSSNKSKELIIDMEIELSYGKNKIQVAVLNEKGVESVKETKYIEYTGATSKHDLYIVAIGVSEYTDSEYNLTYASKDVNDFVEYMDSQSSLFNKVHIYKYLDELATLPNLKEIESILKDSKVDDEVIVYFAGHGLLDENSDYFLAMSDVDFNNPSTNGLYIDEFESFIDVIPARKKIMFIDACHSGEVDKEEVLIIENEMKSINDKYVKFRGFKSINSKPNTSGNNLKNSFYLMKEVFSDLRRGSGGMIISSAGGGEFAYESDQWKNGVFTYSVLKGLRDKSADLDGDGAVSVTELSKYVNENVRVLTNGQQNPTFRRENIEFDYNIIE